MVIFRRQCLGGGIVGVVVCDPDVVCGAATVILEPWGPKNRCFEPEIDHHQPRSSVVVRTDSGIAGLTVLANRLENRIAIPEKERAGLVRPGESMSIDLERDSVRHEGTMGRITVRLGFGGQHPAGNPLVSNQDPQVGAPRMVDGVEVS